MKLSRRGSDDLPTSSFPSLGWHDAESVEASIESLTAWADNNATDAIDWYLKEKRSKGRWSRILRLVAIVGAIGAAAAPIGAAQTDRGDALFVGYVLLAVAATAVAIDRYLGLSSAWMRYMTTALMLRRMRSAFQVRLAQSNYLVASTRQAPVEVVIDLIAEYVDEINQAVSDETLAWRMEFESALEELRAVARSDATTVALGAKSSDPLTITGDR